MTDDRRGEDMTADGAFYAMWADAEDRNVFHVAQGAHDRITLTRFQAVVLGHELAKLAKAENQ